jgi:hypothetical protein
VRVIAGGFQHPGILEIVNCGAIGEPVRIVQIPDPVPDNIPDYVPDTFPQVVPDGAPA